MEVINLNSKLIRGIQTYFRNQPVLKAYLFGSVVKNQQDSKSDLDILVKLDYSKPIGLNFMQMQLDLEDIVNRKVDLVSENAISKYIKPFIDEEKILIYEK